MTDFKPREITFDQIRKGDNLLITDKSSASVITTKQGIANENLGVGSEVQQRWVADTGVWLIGRSESFRIAITITLLNREAAKPWEASDAHDYDIEVKPWTDGAWIGVTDFDGGAFVELNRESTIALRDYLNTILGD